MTDQVIKFFIVFFVVVEPLSIAPVFVSLTSGASPEYQRKMAVEVAERIAREAREKAEKESSSDSKSGQKTL